MNSSRWSLLSGSGLLLLGLTVLIGWSTHQPALIQLQQNADGMPYSTAAGFVLVGLLLVSIGLESRREPAAARGRTLSGVLAILLILLGIGALLEWQMDVRLGLSPDAGALRQWFADPNPFAGRMRPLAALSLIAVGVVALLLPRIGEAWSYVTAQALALFIVIVGCLGVLGHLVGFGIVLGWYLGPVLAAGAGFILCGLTLSLVARRGSAYRLGGNGNDGIKVTLVAGAVVVATGLGGILGGFAVLYPQAVGEMQNNLALSLKSRGVILENALRQGWIDSYNFGNQPLRLAAMGRLSQHPDDSRLRSELAAVAERYRDFGFSGVAFEDAAGRRVASAGTFVADPDLRVAIATPSPSELLWQQGYVLHARVDMVENGRLVGRLEAERRLSPGSDLHETAPFGTSLDFAVCAPAGSGIDCFPFRSTAGKVLRRIPPTVDGQPLPMSHAVAGKTGIVQAIDYRGVPVIAAHTPIGGLGLGAVLKIDAAELYQPIARRLGGLLAMLAVVAAAAVALLRIQVVPLVRTMAREIEDRKLAEGRLRESQATLAEITSTLGEGVCVLDERGIVTFINPEAERLLGWPAGELIGADAHDAFHRQAPDGTITPSELCPIHQAVQAGQPYRTLGDWFMRRDGSFLPVSIIARPILRDAQVKGSVVSFRDISDRKRIEEIQSRLGASLRRLSEIAALSHLPFAEQLHRALIVGAEHLGLELGIISHIEGGRYEVVAQTSPSGTLEDGQVFPFGATYCSITLAEKRVVAISHMGVSEYLGHPCYREFKLETYIGAAVMVGNEVFGTVNFSSPQPFHRSFDDGDREFVALLARWAGSAIERHRANEATRQNERRLRALLDAGDESVLLLSPGGRILAINAFAARRFGDVPEKMAGRDFLALMPPDLAASRREALAYVVAAGEPIHTQDRRQGIFFDNSIYPVKDDFGKVESIAVYAKDVTEVQRARQVEDIFRHLDTVLLKWRMDLGAVAQIFCDDLLPVFDLESAWIGRAEEDGQITILASADAGHGALDRIKESGIRWKGAPNCCLPMAEVISGGHRRQWGGDDAPCCTCGFAAGAEAVLLLPLSLRGAAWGVLALYGSGRSELETAQRSLDAIARRLGSALEAALQQEWLTLLDSALAGVSNAVMITDAKARIVWANQSLAELTGYGIDEILGKTPQMFSSGSQDAEFYRGFWETIRAGQAWRGEIVNARRDGDRYVVSQTVTPLLNANGQISHYVAVVEDISERRAMEERIRHAATFDHLTDLPNRGLFFDRLGQALAQARREEHGVAVLFLDLDHFKEVNDTLGHDAGDLLLKTVAQRLCGQVRASDTVARLAGDEFTVILPRIAKAGDAVRVAEKIIAAIARPFDAPLHEVHIGVSIGIALFPDHGDNTEQVLNMADRAMYQAKEAGRNTVRVYVQDDEPALGHGIRGAAQTLEFEGSP